MRHETAPDRVTLWPEIFTLVVETHGVAVEHDTQRHAIHARADAAVIKRRTRVDGHAMRLGRVSDGIGACIDHVFEQHSHVEARAADQEIVRHPFAVDLAPRFTQPFAIGFEAAGCEHAGARFNAFVADVRGDKAIAVELDSVYWRVVADLHAQCLRTAEVGVDEGLAAAHEKCVGARDMQRAGERRLEMHAMAAHPVAACRRFADREACERFVGQTTGDLEQVLPVLFFRIGFNKYILRRIVHAAQIAGVLRITAAPFARCCFEQQYRCTRLARHQCGAQGRIAAADH